MTALRLIGVMATWVVATSSVAAATTSESTAHAWTEAQLTAFRAFKNAAPGSRKVVAQTVVSAFPIAFDYDTMQTISVSKPLISRDELIGFLGPPETEFSLADQPTYLGGAAKLEFDPRDLHLLLYDIDCLAKKRSGDEWCTTLDVISLSGKIVRLTLNKNHRTESEKWLRK